MEGEIPSPNFSQGNSGFLQFSSTPNEGKNFKPKWGKKNRQDNWNRFGQSVSQDNSYGGQSPVTPMHSRGGWQAQGYGRGGGGYRGHQHHNRGGRGGGGGYHHRGRGGGGYDNSMHSGGGGYNNSRGRGNNHHHQGQHQDSGEGWFHPGMLEDPWAELERAREHEQYEHEDPGQAWPHNAWEVTTETEKEEQQMSESMIAQVGDTLCERNERLLEDTENNSTLDPETSKSDNPVELEAEAESTK